MSNRKRRTATADFLYRMARLDFQPNRHPDMLKSLVKKGLVERTRHNYYRVSDKGWKILLRRAGSEDQRLRHHQHTIVRGRVERCFNNKTEAPLHEIISETINYPCPGEIKFCGVPVGLPRFRSFIGA